MPIAEQCPRRHCYHNPTVATASPLLMSAGDFIFISGAAGVNASAINGVYDRTSETSGGYAVYAKRGDGSMCMEHFQGTKSWQVKHVSDKGKDGCNAYVAGGCAAEACTSRQWMVSFDNKTHSDAPLVKMVAGAEAQRQVGCFRLHAHHHKHPPTCLPLLPLTCFCFVAGR